MSQILYLPEFIELVSQIVFLAYFTVSRAFYHYIKKNVTKLISTRVREQVSKIVFLAYFTVLGIFTTI